MRRSAEESLARFLCQKEEAVTVEGGIARRWKQRQKKEMVTEDSGGERKTWQLSHVTPFSHPVDPAHYQGHLLPAPTSG
ncbi:hypothetical protein GDO86_013606 [Hymenochirus boettgeri]|uniref:Uncharacterized protein n=1 Tax=Hymenochirus boettgeri TaxID=247094 RepID=A0A8T2IXB6_9PIPI|nr:hypothetical protein GDO86_013606 [Hymenochirus boettgeri]